MGVRDSSSGRCEGDRRASNPRPSEPQSADTGFWVLPDVEKSAYLKCLHCWRLPAVSGCSALSGVSSGVSSLIESWLRVARFGIEKREASPQTSAPTISGTRAPPSFLCNPSRLPQAYPRAARFGVAPTAQSFRRALWASWGGATPQSDLGMASPWGQEVSSKTARPGERSGPASGSGCRREKGILPRSFSSWQLHPRGPNGPSLGWRGTWPGRAKSRPCPPA